MEYKGWFCIVKLEYESITFSVIVYGQRKGQKIQFYKINDKLNSAILNNIIIDLTCKTNSLLCKINVHKINQRYLNTNQTQKVKPTDINVKRTGSNMRHRLLESGMVRTYSVSPWDVLHLDVSHLPQSETSYCIKILFSYYYSSEINYYLYKNWNMFLKNPLKRCLLLCMHGQTRQRACLIRIFIY